MLLLGNFGPPLGPLLAPQITPKRYRDALGQRLGTSGAYGVDFGASGGGFRSLRGRFWSLRGRFSSLRALILAPFCISLAKKRKNVKIKKMQFIFYSKILGYVYDSQRLLFLPRRGFCVGVPKNPCPSVLLRVYKILEFHRMAFAGVTFFVSPIKGSIDFLSWFHKNPKLLAKPTSHNCFGGPQK